jgi:hypothetical protein
VVAGKILRDAELHIQNIVKSSLDWTVLRSPPMTKFGKKGQYRLLTTVPWPWATVYRQNVAVAMADLADSKEWVRQAPIIYR